MTPAPARSRGRTQVRTTVAPRGPRGAIDERPCARLRERAGAGVMRAPPLP